VEARRRDRIRQSLIDNLATFRRGAFTLRIFQSAIENLETGKVRTGLPHHGQLNVSDSSITSSRKKPNST